MTKKMDIANLALLRAGQSVALTTWPDTTTTPGIAMNTLYDTSAKLVLKELPWPFARRSIRLQQETVDVDTQWQFAYHLPPDMLYPLRLVSPSVIVWLDFVINGKLLLTNIGPIDDTAGPYLQYIRSDVIDPQVCEPPVEFVDCLAWRLAAEYAVAITGKGDIARAMMEQYKMSLASARRSISQYNKATLPHLSEEYIKARQGNGLYATEPAITAQLCSG